MIVCKQRGTLEAGDYWRSIGDRPYRSYLIWDIGMRACVRAYVTYGDTGMGGMRDERG